MPWCFERFQSHPAEFDRAVIPERREAVLCLRFGAKINCCARAISQFQMSGYKIRVQMGQNHVLDLNFLFGRKFQIPLDVTLGINDGSRAGLLITDQIGSVREAVEVKLLENHVSLGLVEMAKRYHIAWRVLRGIRRGRNEC